MEVAQAKYYWKTGNQAINSAIINSHRKLKRRGGI